MHHRVVWGCDARVLIMQQVLFMEMEDIVYQIGDFTQVEDVIQEMKNKKNWMNLDLKELEAREEITNY